VTGVAQKILPQGIAIALPRAGLAKAVQPLGYGTHNAVVVLGGQYLPHLGWGNRLHHVILRCFLMPGNVALWHHMKKYYIDLAFLAGRKISLPRLFFSPDCAAGFQILPSRVYNTPIYIKKIEKGENYSISPCPNRPYPIINLSRAREIFFGLIYRDEPCKTRNMRQKII